MNFWTETAKISNKHFCDSVNSYMYYMIQAYKEHLFELTKKTLIDGGKDVELFEGVGTWFKRINEFGEKLGVKIEHYVISSGLTSMIEGTSIAKEFKKNLCLRIYL